MKRVKTIMLFLMLITAAGTVYADLNQNDLDQDASNLFGFSSYQAEFSQGILTNELDAASVASEEFTQLNKTYLLTGVSNLQKLLSTNGTVILPNIQFGAFLPGEMNKSFVVNFAAVRGGTVETAATNGTTSTTAAVATTSGSTTTTHIWTTSTTESTFALKSFDSLMVEGQGLLDLGFGVAGVYLEADITDSSDPGQNFTKVTTDYYDANAAAANTAPSATKNYSSTETNKNMNHIYDFTLGIPLFMKTGELSHSAAASFSTVLTDTSSAYTFDWEDGTQTAAGLVTSSDNKVTNVTSDIGINLDYALEMPGFFSEVKGRSKFGVALGTTLSSAIYNSQTFEIDYNYPGLARTPTGNVHDTENSKFALAVDFSSVLSASHSFEYNFGKGFDFVIVPGLAVQYAVDDRRTGAGLLTEHIDVATTNNTAPNDTIDGSDLTTTTTTTVDRSGQIDALHEVDVAVEIPAVIKIKPEGWICGFTFGATAFAAMNNNIDVNKDDLVTTVRVVNSGSATSDNTSVTYSGGTNTTDYSVTWDFRGEVSLGANFEFTEDIKMDVNIDSTFAGGVFDLRALAIQAIIALP